MALVIDVMDVLYTKNVDVICLVSSDCDFTPLVTRTLADGKFVIGFGERKAPVAFVNSCSRFLYLRSEEHTSELQSRPHLVCRLLLEKKKDRKSTRLNSS